MLLVSSESFRPPFGTFGVGHCRIASVSDVPGCITPVVVVCRPDARESPSVAVGQNEEPFALMGGSHVGCAKQAPLRIEPEPGQIPENEGQSASGNKGRHVLQPHEPGSYFANAIADVGPDPPLVFDAFARAGGGPGLTREARRDAIHDATPASAIEGEQVRPDRRRIQPPFCHARDNCCGSIGFPLDVSDSTVSGDHELKAKLESPDTSAKGDTVDGTNSHTYFTAQSD